MTRLLVILIAVVWCLPAVITARTVWVQWRTGSTEVPPGILNPRLEGLVGTQPRPAITARGFWDGEFQRQMDTWFAESFGLRGWFIRLNNQVDYSVFGVSRQRNDRIVVGLNRQLYELPYIREACRMIEPSPTARLDELAERIAKVQSLFEQRKVRFVTIITPQKASIYPEFVPDGFHDNAVASHRDYDTFVPLLRKHDVNLIDGHDLTLKAKSEFDYPLFCQGSTHWNNLGAFPTASALLPMLGDKSSKSAAQLKLGSISANHTATGMEADLVAFMNVLIPPRDYIVPVPEIQASGSLEGTNRWAVVIVGGSFVDKLYHIWGASDLFRRVDWYRYYIDGLWRYPAENGRKFDIDQLPWKKVFLETNVVVLEINESNIRGGHITRFLDDALRHLADESPSAR